MKIRSTHALPDSPLRCSSRPHRSAPSPSNDRPGGGTAASSLAVSFATGVAVALLLGTLPMLPLPARAESLRSIARDDDQLRVIDPVDGTDSASEIWLADNLDSIVKHGGQAFVNWGALSEDRRAQFDLAVDEGVTVSIR